MYGIHWTIGRRIAAEEAKMPDKLDNSVSQTTDDASESQNENKSKDIQEEK